MSDKSLLPPAVSQYVNTVLTQESPVQRALRDMTQKLPEAQMQISPDQGAFLSFMTQLIDARRAIEVGTFTGYSAICIAGALPPDGQLICCDASEQWTGMARPFWEEAGVAGRIDLRLGPAEQTLRAMIADGLSGTFDLAFIDADKEGYDTYFELTYTLLRPGGLAILDNMLRGGKIVDEQNQNPGTTAIRKLSLKLRDDARVDTSLVTIGDGFLLVRKK